MYIIEGLKKQNEYIEPTISSLKSFIDAQSNRSVSSPTQLDKKNKISQREDFFNRRYKEVDIKKVIQIDFDKVLKNNSLFTFNLKKGKEINWTERTDNIGKNASVFYPLFFSNGISNNQYKALFNMNNIKITNKNSFSDFFIRGSSLSEMLKKTNSEFLSLSTSQFEFESDMKKYLMKDFYEFISNLVSFENDSLDDMIFYLNFDSFSSADFVNTNYDEVVSGIFSSYPSLPDDFVSLTSNQLNLNYLVYFLENFSHHVQFIFKPKLEKSIYSYPIEELFTLNSSLFYEVPTGEKPILKSFRHKSLGDTGELPQLSIFELYLVRIVLTSLNKQGTGPGCGYEFTFSEDADVSDTKWKSARLTTDAYGNISMNAIQLHDKRRELLFTQNLIEKISLFDDKNYDGEPIEALIYLRRKFSLIVSNFLSHNPKISELIWDMFDNKRYESCAKLLHDYIFKNLGVRVSEFEHQKFGDRTKTKITSFDLKDLIFLLNVFNSKINSERLRNYIMDNETINQTISDAEKNNTLSEHDFYYLLGKLSGLVVNNSRNKDSVEKHFLRVDNRKTVFELLVKRISIDNHNFSHWDKIKIKNIMHTLDKFKTSNSISDKMDSDIKFVYLTGFLNANFDKSNNTKKQEEIQND